MTTTVQRLTKLRNERLADAARIQNQIDAAQGRRKLLCHHCGRRSEIKKTTYIQPYWYERPYGCTGGDTWHLSREGRFVCLHCGWENRFWPKRGHDGVDNRGWICELKNRFAKVIKVYKAGDGRERTEDWKWRDRPEWCN